VQQDFLNRQVCAGILDHSQSVQSLFSLTTCRGQPAHLETHLKQIVTGKVVLVIGNKIKYYLGADRRR
jgi:hypothetical protein